MAVFVVDKGVITLRNQIDEAAPERSKASDGTVGDAAHAARESDHNPEDPPPAGNPAHQVDAGDFTHDPDHGADMGVVTESIRQSKDPRVKYVIFNRRIFYGTRLARIEGLKAFEWYPYTGKDPHTNHAHVSVEDTTHDQTQPWQIGIAMPTPEQLFKAKVPGTSTPGHKEDREFGTLLDDQQLRMAAALEKLDDLTALVTALTKKVEEGNGGAPGA